MRKKAIKKEAAIIISILFISFFFFVLKSSEPKLEFTKEQITQLNEHILKIDRKEDKRFGNYRHRTEDIKAFENYKLEWKEHNIWAGYGDHIHVTVALVKELIGEEQLIETVEIKYANGRVYEFYRSLDLVMGTRWVFLSRDHFPDGFVNRSWYNKDLHAVGILNEELRFWTKVTNKELREE